MKSKVFIPVMLSKGLIYNIIPEMGISLLYPDTSFHSPCIKYSGHDQVCSVWLEVGPG